jgi:ubiquinone/menaquinone biosynthesis C-methylase UbiE
MGSKIIQGQLWGNKSADWASIQEPTSKVGYQYVLQYLKLSANDKLLDVGCGSGFFSDLAYHQGAAVTGIDASDGLLAQAKLRNPNITFLTGEMEELPFDNNVFDIVCGFNSFQYAASIKNAFNEVKRVLIPGGKIVVMIWGNKKDCEAATYLKAIGSMLPPPPPGAPGPFALSENHLLENTLEEAGFKIINNVDLISIWDYPNIDAALKGLLSAGPAAKAIEINGFDKVLNTVSEAVKPYVKSNSHVVYNNKFRVIIAEK